MKKIMLINAAEPEESRIAVLEDNVLEELYMERADESQLVGNIYKARVVNIEKSIQAAFVDFGGPRHGFLHVSDVLRGPEGPEPGDNAAHRRASGHIERLLQRGREVVAQVSREGIGNKGPSMTMYLSLPGRYLVLMPGIRRRGVSKKIADATQRERLKQIVQSIKLKEDIGIIARTAGENRTRREILRDLDYLVRLWTAVKHRIKHSPAGTLVYQESDLVIRAIRDVFTAETSEIVIDSEGVYRKAQEFLRAVMPRYRNRLTLYKGDEPLFHKYRLEEEIERIKQRRVPLKSGGSLVIEQTEALLAVDVNSGSFRNGADAEETAYRTNLQAAREIARQVRLRDAGGVIIADFIDMERDDHKREVERVIGEALKGDRARTRMCRMSRFGVIEITRQRMRPGLERTIFQECPYCRGSGIIKSVQSISIETIRRIKTAVLTDGDEPIECYVHPDVAAYLQNNSRKVLSDLEDRFHKKITITPDDACKMEDVKLVSKGKEGKAPR